MKTFYVKKRILKKYEKYFLLNIFCDSENYFSYYFVVKLSELIKFYVGNKYEHFTNYYLSTGTKR